MSPKSPLGLPPCPLRSRKISLNSNSLPFRSLKFSNSHEGFQRSQVHVAISGFKLLDYLICANVPTVSLQVGPKMTLYHFLEFHQKSYLYKAICMFTKRSAVVVGKTIQKMNLYQRNANNLKMNNRHVSTYNSSTTTPVRNYQRQLHWSSLPSLSFQEMSSHYCHQNIWTTMTLGPLSTLQVIHMKIFFQIKIFLRPEKFVYQLS